MISQVVTRRDGRGLMIKLKIHDIFIPETDESRHIHCNLPLLPSIMSSATENSDVAAELPKYADVAGDSSPNLFHSESPNRSQFKTGLQDGKGYAWLTLQVGSRSPSAASPPLFFEGDTITGIVHLDADKTDSVKLVYVEVRTNNARTQIILVLKLLKRFWLRQPQLDKSLKYS